MRTIFTHGIPRLNPTRMHGDSQSSESKQYPMINPTLGSFELLDNIPVPHRTHPICWTLAASYPRQLLPWNSESSIAEHVSIVLQELLSSFGLDQFHVYAEAHVTAAHRLDRVLALRVCNYPIGFIELKIPSRKITGYQFGQAWCYLQKLRDFHGVLDPICIITSYTSWYICWLSDSAKLVSSKHLTLPPKFQHVDPFTITAADVVSGLEIKPPRVDGANRVYHSDPQGRTGIDQAMYASREYKWDDADLWKVLYSAVVKMASSTIRPVEIANCVDRLFIVLCEKKITWESNPFEKGVYHLDFLSPSRSTSFILLYLLGSGGDGAVWLVSDRQGRVAALKLAFEGADVLASEMAGWVAFASKYSWEKDYHYPRLLQFNEQQQHGVLMPFVWIPPRSSWSSDSSERKQLEIDMDAAINTLAEAQVCHDDLLLRHFGYVIRGRSERQPVLIDFARISSKSPQEALAIMTAAVQVCYMSKFVRFGLGHHSSMPSSVSFQDQLIQLDVSDLVLPSQES